MKKIFIAAGPIIALMLTTLTVCAQSQSRDDTLKDIVAKRTELTKLEKAFLSPTEADRAAYAEFLSAPDTGLVRLLPREVYDIDVYKGTAGLTTVRGGGSYYSFTKQMHAYSEFTDISLEQGHLRVGFAGANYGMITSLGDTPLENLS